MCVHRDNGNPTAGAWLLLAALFSFSIALTAQAPLPGLKAGFTFSPVRPTEGQAVQFKDASKGNPKTWRWDFGDGWASTVQNPSHPSAAPGLKKVTLLVGDGAISKRAIRTINVAGRPTKVPSVKSQTVPAPDEAARIEDKSPLTPSFNFTPSSPAVKQSVQFMDASSGTPTSWRWDFGDGSSSKRQNPSHQYAAAGSYRVRLSVGKDSDIETTSRTLTVAGMPLPKASFMFYPPGPLAGQSVQFMDTSTGDPVSWYWDFADGATSTDQHMSHAFADPGSYNVALTVTNAHGSHTVTELVHVLTEDALAADFTCTPSLAVKGKEILFIDTSTGAPTSWLWDFGDGTTSDSENPRHTYQSAGDYLVILTIKSATTMSTTTKAITVVDEHWGRTSATLLISIL